MWLLINSSLYLCFKDPRKGRWSLSIFSDCDLLYLSKVLSLPFNSLISQGMGHSGSFRFIKSSAFDIAFLVFLNLCGVTSFPLLWSLFRRRRSHLLLRPLPYMWVEGPRNLALEMNHWMFSEIIHEPLLRRQGCQVETLTAALVPAM